MQSRRRWHPQKSARFVASLHVFHVVTRGHSITCLTGHAHNRLQEILMLPQFRPPLSCCKKGAFALVSTLFILALLMAVIASLAVFVTTTQRSAAANRDANSARQSALFGLKLALGELQSSVGPDQRITAPASILGNASNPYGGGIQPAAGQGSWTGVWKADTVAPPGSTPGYNPATPNTRSFVGWLVSSADTSGNFTLPTSLAAVGTSVTSIAPTNNIPNFKILMKNLDGSAYAQAQKVRIDSVPGGKRYFAFVVEDEGVKADLSWSQTPAAVTTGERAQTSRLSAAPGPDYAVLNGTSGNGSFGQSSYPINYPLSNDGTTPFLLNIIPLMRDPADLQGLMSNASTMPAWLKEQRADITWGSRGILADVKLGGLRRDLSLAFEMDGTSDVTSTQQPMKFNQQTGEFVGGLGDRLDSPYQAKGMPVKERFLYRDTKGSGTPFSGDIVRSDSVVRGPNWWALRDYANLYKRLSGTAGSYTLNARSYYPNVSGLNANYHLGNLIGQNSGATPWDYEVNNGSKFVTDPYIFRPARADYAPVMLGAVCLVSALATNPNGTTADLALGLDPIFYLWNPYNRKLKFDNLAIAMKTGFPGSIAFQVTNGSGTITTYGPANIQDYLTKQSSSAGALTYLVAGLTMAPGEICVVSAASKSNPSANSSPLHDIALPGTNTDNASGAICSKIPDATATNWQTVSVNLATDKVAFYYSSAYTGGNQFSFLWTSLPAAGTKATDLSDPANYGDQIQAIDYFAAQGGVGVINPSENLNAPPTFGAPVAASTLVNTKNFMGIFALLAKPASYGGLYPNPVEVFSQFNPIPLSTRYELTHVCQLNQVYNLLGQANNPNTLLQSCGINFSASSPNAGFWGASYASDSTAFPFSNIPSSPLLSLASFSDANLSTRASEPFHAVGNSFASPFVSPVSPYGAYTQSGDQTASVDTASDSSWLLNDALFDRYYLSGIAPAFTIGAGGYAATGSVTATLTQFFSANYRAAQANPILLPYLPPNTLPTAAVTSLAANDGYKKLGAYSLINGVFNVNSTSVAAWTAFLRANRNLVVTDARGGTDTATGSPFPSSPSPAAPGNGASTYWSGFSRLTDAQISSLAAGIVNQVKLRGPFMSLSDFVNHRVGPLNSNTSYMGALQAAIEASGINAAVQAGAGGTAPVYTGSISSFFPNPLPVGNRKTTTGIPGDITQADLLLPLAPRLSARSDTFRIRVYGEVRSKDETRIISQAACEAVVQRVPEYMDQTTDPTHNQPWSEATNPYNPTGSSLNPTNQKFGRRLKVVQFRWLIPNEL